MGVMDSLLGGLKKNQDRMLFRCFLFYYQEKGRDRSIYQPQILYPEKNG